MFTTFLLVLIGFLFLCTRISQIEFMVFIIVMRGILAPNRFWWWISENTLTDASGLQLYRQIKSHSNKPTTPINFFGNQVELVTDINYIKQILDQSPNIFGVGLLKQDFFKPFMPLNVGVSEGCPWVRRRQFN